VDARVSVVCRGSKCSRAQIVVDMDPISLVGLWEGNSGLALGIRAQTQSGVTWKDITGDDTIVSALRMKGVVEQLAGYLTEKQKGVSKLRAAERCNAI